jgi:hypothetical protein
MSIKTYSKDDLISKKVFGISLLVFGICYLFSKNSSSIGIGIASIYIGILITSIRGIEINPEEKKLREFISFFGIKLGSWKNFKTPEYISVFTAKYYDDDGSKNEILNINLFFENSQHMTVYQTGDVEVAFEIANFFKETLNINVLDATKNESKWL